MRKLVAIVLLILLVIACFLFFRGGDGEPLPARPPNPVAPESFPEPIPEPEPARPAPESAAREGCVRVKASHGDAPGLVLLSIDETSREVSTAPPDERGWRSAFFMPAVAGMKISVTAKGFLSAECCLEGPELRADVTLKALAQLTVYGGRLGIDELVVGFQEKEHPLH